MARCLRVVALLAGLTSSLLPGCMHHRIHESASLCAMDSTETGTKEAAEASPKDQRSPYPALANVGAAKNQVETKQEQKRDRLPEPVASEQEPVPKPLVKLDAGRDREPGPTTAPAKEALPPFLPPTPGPMPPGDTTADKPASAGPAPAFAAKAADEPPLVAALRCCLDKRPADAVSRLAGDEKTNQELLLCVFSLAARLSEGRLEPQDIAVVLEELNSVMVPLRSQAALTIDKLCFCKRIFTFGIYDPCPPDQRFRPGQLVYIYAEVRNCSRQKVERAPGKTVHVTDLSSTADIEDYAGHRVWPKQIVFKREKPDESRTPRQDYFDNYHFVVPDLPPGAYKLWVQIEDVGTRPSRRARRSLDFYVTNLSAHTS
jgi:hypothetical protein